MNATKCSGVVMRTADDCILETRELSKRFGGLAALKDVNLKVRRGTIHGLIGPNGAGKTTCFNLLTKFVAPTSGSIIFEGRDITVAKAAEVARQGIARSFQISAVFPMLTVLENILVALQRDQRVVWRFWRSDRCLRTFDERADSLLEAVGLQAWRDRPAGELSYGRRRALEIATTLALEPRLLLLDEPTAGMSHEDIDRIAELIRSAGAGRTVLMVEHNLGVVSSLCDTITVLHRGEVLCEGDYASVSADQRVLGAYLGKGHG
ncbi:MAG: ABC transporter ATP-binding protein [Rhodospirillales bacterium]|nr:ABC transporter ATP-binding protein [Rhodospirillales bacterium]